MIHGLSLFYRDLPDHICAIPFLEHCHRPVQLRKNQINAAAMKNGCFSWFTRAHARLCQGNFLQDLNQPQKMLHGKADSGYADPTAKTEKQRLFAGFD